MDIIERIKNIIRKEVREIYTENILNEMTVTSNVQGYDTPFAFTGGKGKKRKRKFQQIAQVIRSLKKK